MASRGTTKLSENYLPATDPDVPTSLQEIRRAAGKFAKRWAGTTQENANTQVFWTEFFGVFGVDGKRVVLFERHAERLSTGQRGRIDVFWPGELLVEQKSLGKSLTKATEQAYDYLDGLSDSELPSQVIVSDFEFRSDFPVPQPLHGTQLHGLGDNLRMIGPPGSQHRGQQDMGGTATAAPGPARKESSVHRRHPAPNHTLHPETPGPQLSTARRADQFTAKDLGFDSGRIVAYGKQQRDSFRVRTTWCGFETGTGSFVFKIWMQKSQVKGLSSA